MFINLIISVSLGLISCIIFRKFSKLVNLVDIPDGIRKTHQGSIPLGGGLAIAFTFFLCSIFFVETNHFLFALSVSSLVLLFIGLLDDLITLPISLRLISQILVSWIVIIVTDVYIRDLGDLLGLGHIYLGQLGIPVTIFMLVGVCNAFNMLDGMDGLVSMISMVALLIISIVSFYNGIDFSWSIALLGAIFAFFLFNIGVLGKKFQIFLGDSGAIPLGFFLAWILVFLSQEPNKVIEPVSAIWIVLIPLVDALSTFYRRIRAGQGIFLGDRYHIHFILLDGGLSKNLTLTILSLLSLLGALIALYFLINPVQPYYMFYGFLTIWVFYLLLTKNTPKK